MINDDPVYNQKHVIIIFKQSKQISYLFVQEYHS